MTYEMLQRVSLFTGIGSAVMTVVAVALFFWLDIRSVIGFFTGRTRRKGIDEIRKAAQDGTLNHHTGAKKSNVKTEKNRRKQTDGKRKTNAVVRVPAEKTQKTEEVTTDRLPNRASIDHDGAEQTTLLDAPAVQTSVLEGAGNLTTVLTESGEAGTTVLPTETAAGAAVFTQQPFEIEFDITYIYSDEVI